MPQYEISDCGMVIGIELRQFPIKALITLTPLLLRAHVILSYPGRSGEVQLCLQAKAALTNCTLSNTVHQQNRRETVLGPSSGHAELLKGFRQEADSEYESTCDEPAKTSSYRYSTEDFLDSHGKKEERSETVTNNRPKTTRTHDARGKHSTATGHRVSPLNCYYSGPDRVLLPSA